ncbi:energy transducer TonB [Thalassotalea eurytherma]|uniref:Protein TonB n=1 Tax=Thalassotalea eurytherma TaxID=1144278 RepID=A0ABQ6H7C3_9GAMM|nr:energy transducer TonB [Thalassotalea eurytherma]GLX82771.1 protein TonB [Thalassotalea eurytherma]
MTTAVEVTQPKANLFTHASARYALAIGLAVSVTFFLLWGMQVLIKGGNDVLTDPPKGNVLDFIRLKQEETPQKKERKPQKPPKPQTPPPQVEPMQMAKANPNANAISTSFTADVQTGSGLSGGLSLASSDGEYLPLFKVAPIYPRRAQSRGIEGYVILSFTVTKNGSVKDPVVVEAKPESIFDRAAIDAALKFKYRPRVVDGEPMEVSGVQNKITFEIDG